MDNNRVTASDGYQLLSQYRPQLMGIAMLWVMLFHAYHLKFNIALLDNIKALGFGGVDIFILLSGLGIYISLSRRNEDKFIPYFWRRCKRILPAYWLIVGLYSIYLCFQKRISWPVLLWNLSSFHYWFDVEGSFNWYVPAILTFYLLAPLWVQVLKRYNHHELFTALTFPFSYGLYRLSIPFGLNYTEDFLYRIPTFAMGMLVGHYILENKKFTTKHLLAWGGLSVFGITLAVLRLKGVLYISTCYMINCCIVLLCFLLAKTLDLLRCAPINRVLKGIGENSLEIYLLNVIITREFYIMEPLLHFDSRYVGYYIVIYGINIGLGFLLHWGIANLKVKLKSGRK